MSDPVAQAAGQIAADAAPSSTEPAPAASIVSGIVLNRIQSIRDYVAARGFSTDVTDEINAHLDALRQALEQS